MNNNLKTKKTVRLLSYALGVSVLWSLLIAISLIWNMKIEKTGTFDAARIEARTAFEKDVIYRRWNAEHGGVYVPVTEKTQPNPYLDVPERDIITPLGKKLTKINPAYMTRQVHEIAMQAYGVKGHITSLNPIRPANAPDFWETQALKGFQAGEEEVSSVEKMEGKYYMRLMRPLLTESGCLKCHAAQGYKLGNIRGGISVAAPMAPLLAIGRSRIITFCVMLGLLWLIGLTGIGFSAHRLSQQIHKRIGAEETLRESESQKRSILDGITTNLAFVNENLEIQWLNKASADSVNKSPEEMIGRKCHEFWADPETPCDGCPTAKAFRTKKTEQTIMHTPDGRIWDEKGEPVFNESGKMIGVLEIAHDITAKAKAEEALRKSEERYRAVAEDTPVLICRFLPGGEITYVNDAYCKYFEKTQEELLGKNFQSPIPETDRETVMANISSLTLDMSIQTHEHRVIAPDGGIHWHRWTNRALFNEQGQAVAYQSIGEDITDRRLAEAQTQEWKNRYEAAILASGNLLYDWNSTTNEVTYGGNLGEILGYSFEEMEGGLSRWLELIHPDDQDYFNKAIEHLITLKEPAHLKYRIRKKDGKYIIVEDNGHFITDDQGNMIQMVGFVKDVTGRVQAEEALRESEEKFRNIFENLQDVYFKTSLDGIIEEVSPSAENSSGYSVVELKGKKVDMLYQNPQDREGLLNELIEKGKVRGFELLFKKKNGEPYDVSVNADIYFSEDGEPVGMNGTIRDISEQKKLESQLHQAQKMESIGTLAGGIAHDFNNVLYSIIGYTELTMDDMPEGSLAQENLKEVFKGAMRAKDMVQQILAFSRKAQTEKKPIKVQTVVKEALKLLRTSIPTTIEIRPNIDANCGPVLADSTQIHQVVINLATNAYQAMREKGGVLELTLMEKEISSDDSDLDLHPGTYLKLTVNDTGHGMDKAVIEKIFDPYFTTRGPGGGTGMGLAVVHGIVKSHGGDIRVYSELGEGATFNVYLPLIEARTVERETISTEPVLTGTERILFVDDEEPIVFMAQQILERLGYQVTPRTSSVEALEAFRAKPDEYDLVITDMTMPNMTGIELAPRLKEIRPDIPIIICTGFSEMVDENRAKATGIREYVMKPIVIEEIARTIRKVLDEGQEK